ncbi:Ribosomal large subunit pseudouridine synthase F [compost metagenome]|uniref:rRNA pseudouridine synthase n=1 Tax=Pseudomonas TaxID=286 RepID=UPI00040263CF|nr:MULTISPECIES: rRNA pseudouridine synthase [Pseudomonas]MCW2267747.1 23S rRNA pseudouridine2604 synthase [Pseudomonas sp. JUb96]PRA71439.1 RNA-binding protein [Pseudomonas sp. MYb187]
MSEPIRLSKRLIELVGCSRREAELYIEGGWVTVDGTVVDEPQFKVAGQKVELQAGARAEALEPVTLLLNQPTDLDIDSACNSISADSLSEAHRDGRRPLKGHFARLSCVAPLQQGASGLQVFTQDWRVTRKLSTDLAKLEQEYIVEVSGQMIAHGLERLNRGFNWKGNELPKIKASWQNETRLRMVLKNPQPGLIALLCSSVGVTPVSMRRIRLGGVAMSKLPLGQWRYLASTEKF